MVFSQLLSLLCAFFCLGGGAVRLQSDWPLAGKLQLAHVAALRSEESIQGISDARPRCIAIPTPRSHFGDSAFGRSSPVRIASSSSNTFTISDNFRGVTFDGPSGRWAASTCVDGVQKTLGLFDNDLRAALAHDDELRAQGLTAETLRYLNFRTEDDVRQASSNVREEILSSLSEGSSVYNGVDFDMKSGKWSARMHLNGIERDLGLFDSELGAAIAYDDQLRDQGLDFTMLRRLNFLLTNDVQASASRAELSTSSTRSSIYSGVHFEKRTSKWVARATLGGQRKRLGQFNTELDAALAYDEALRAHGIMPRNVRNLNFVTFDDAQQASSNAKGQGLSNQSGSIYRGVYLNKQTGRWRARAQVNGKDVHLGLFDEELEAASAFDEELRAQGLTPKTLRFLNFRTQHDFQKACSDVGDESSSSSSKGSSIYKGVRKVGGKWRARAAKDGTLLHLGMFDKELDAAWAYDQEIRAQGLIAKTVCKLNFVTEEDVRQASSDVED